jgi:hypothetical protein
MTTRIPKPYTPKGIVVPFIEAANAEPHRIWSYPEAAEVMGIIVKKVSATVATAVEAGLLFKGRRLGATVLSAREFENVAPPPRNRHLHLIKIADHWTTTMDDPRVPKVVAGWVPPKMNPPRAAA